MKRASPIEHIVRKHRRSNAPIVHEYLRGEGEAPAETHKLSGMRATKDNGKSHGGFSVNIQYADSGGTSGVVKSTNYKDALRKGIGLARQQIRSITLRKMEPLSVEVK